MDEFRKFYGGSDIEVLNNSFELYQNIIKTTDIEGYILNPASEKYLFKKEFILGIENIPKTNNWLELFFKIVFPKKYRKRFKTTKGVKRFLRNGKIKWYENTVLKMEIIPDKMTYGPN
jgi:hypothetical protein